MNMNNKGQTLVIFVIMLPIIVLGIVYVFLKVYSTYEKKKQENITNIICEKYKKNNDINKLIELGTKNDSTQKIEIKRINDSIEVNIEKETFLKIKIRTNTTC